MGVNFKAPCEEKKILLSHFSGELSKRDDVVTAQQKQLRPAEYRVGQRLAVCFIVPLGSHLLHSPDNRDNNITRGIIS